MKRWLMILLILPCLMGRAFAEELEEAAPKALDAYAVQEALPPAYREISGDLDLTGGYDASGALERLWQRLLDELARSLREDAREAVRLLAVVLLCAVVSALLKDKKQTDFVELAGCASASLLLAGGVDSLVKDCFFTLTQLNDYARAALPAVYTAAAASGAPVSASARYAGACFALDAMMSAAERLILPLLAANTAMAVCAAVYENALLRALIQLAKKLATWLMSGMCIAFTAMLSVTGVVSGAADAAAVKTAKTVISASLPVIGGLMADAASSVLSAAALVRNSAGAFGAIAVCSLCLAPFAALAVRRFFFSLIAAAADMTAGGRLARLFQDMAGVIGLLLGLVGSFAVMLFFSVVSALRTVGAV